jgi:dual specificity phosphatase 3
MTGPEEKPRATQLKIANAQFVTDRLLIGGDLDAWDGELAVRQLLELLDVGVTHVLDARVEWSDEELVAQLAPHVSYLHLGIDDAGQRVPGTWFDRVAEWAVDALDGPDATVLAHCHMGINRGPSAGLAILLATGWQLGEALDAIRSARPFAYTDYAEDALRWHHRRTGTSGEARRRDRETLARWRTDDPIDVGEVIRLKREQDADSALPPLHDERVTS